MIQLRFWFFGIYFACCCFLSGASARKKHDVDHPREHHDLPTSEELYDKSTDSRTDADYGAVSNSRSKPYVNHRHHQQHGCTPEDRPNRHGTNRVKHGPNYSHKKKKTLPDNWKTWYQSDKENRKPLMKQNSKNQLLPRRSRTDLDDDAKLSSTELEKKQRADFPDDLYGSEDGKTGSCECGTNDVLNVRVIGGRDAELNEFPWQAGLFSFNKGVFCGGALINTRYILTAAHCVINKTQDTVKVVLADHDLSTNMETKSKSIRVEKIIIYPGYLRSIYSNDIAVLRMASAVTFDNTMKPACFPRPGRDYIGNKVTIVGWGATGEGKPSHPILQKLDLPIISQEKCKSVYGTIIQDSVMCVGGVSGKDACQGDSGGPLVRFDGVRYWLIGVVSWGSGCGNPDLPGVYARVDKFLDWIYGVSKDGEFCK